MGVEGRVGGRGSGWVGGLVGGDRGFRGCEPRIEYIFERA